MIQFETKPENRRLFIALEVPGEWKEVICSRQKRFPFGRWTRREQIHLTLRFLGDVCEDKIPELEAYCREIKHPSGPVPFSAEEIGVFPNQRRATSLHIRLAPDESLLKLKKELDGGLRRILGMEAEESYIPHITIMRMHHPASAAELEQLFEWGRGLELPRVNAGMLTLFHSHFTDRLNYTPLANAML